MGMTDGEKKKKEEEKEEEEEGRMKKEKWLLNKQNNSVARDVYLWPNIARHIPETGSSGARTSKIH